MPRYTSLEEFAEHANDVFSLSPHGLLLVNPELEIVKVSPSLCEDSGYSLEELVGHNPNIFASGKHDSYFYKDLWKNIQTEGYWMGEIWDRRKNGDIYPSALSVTSIVNENGSTLGYLGATIDLNRFEAKGKDLNYLAHHDPLTGLPNRLLMRGRLDQAIETAKRHSSNLALLFLDLDHFKPINDSLGHLVGDALLQEIATRLTSSVRSEDIVTRWGGDEFIVMLSELNSEQDAVLVASKIQEALKAPFIVDDHSLRISASIGISRFPQDASNSNDLIETADVAMFHAKVNGKNQFSAYSQEMTETIHRRLLIERELEKALALNQLELFYQPIFDLQLGTIKSCEALLRWQHSTEGYISPEEFIPIAEKSGIILQLGEWVLKTACHQAKHWQNNHINIPVAINISTLQLKDSHFLDVVKNILNDTKLPAGLIEFEITESVIIDETGNTIETIGRLSDMGINISIDDFGTGYSSLSYLHKFPANKLKIDRSFIAAHENEAQSRGLVNSIIALAHAMGLSVVAEGVEDASTLSYLTRAGCEQAQGNFIGLPVSAHDFDPYTLLS